MKKKQVFLTVDKSDTRKYRFLFDAFQYFENYINFAFDHLDPIIVVDSKENPNAAFFYTSPAYFLTGDSAQVDVQALFSNVSEYNWFVVSNEDWSRKLKSYFGDHLKTYPRTLFDSTSLDPVHIRSLISDAPEGLKIEIIGQNHVQQTTGLFYKDVLKQYFVGSDFLETGLGYCVMDGDILAGFAAANFPIRDNVLDIYVRLLEEPKYRRKGLGTTLSALLINACLERGIEPVWDAANEISANLALKLGFMPLRKWEMYQFRL